MRTIATGETLRDYLERNQREYRKILEVNPRYSIPWEDENLPYVIMDWCSMMGDVDYDERAMLEEEYGLTDEEIDWLIETAEGDY